MKIFKYHLKDDTGEQLVKMPRTAKPISFGVDPRDDYLAVWVTVEAEEPLVDHRFWLAFTGQEFPALFSHKFMGTTKYGELGLIIHCFYNGEVSQ